MTPGDLTTLPAVKQWLNLTSTNDDALLTTLITAASTFIQSWLGRTIAAASYAETRDGTGGQRLQFRNNPVTAVASLSIDDQVIPASTSSFMAGYVFSATQIDVRGYHFTRRALNVAISYTAGYATTPPDLAEACTELVGQRYRERSRIGLTSETINDVRAVTYTIKDIPGYVMLVMQQYRQVAPV